MGKNKELTNKEIIIRTVIMIIIVILISVIYIIKINGRLIDLSKQNIDNVTNQIKIYIEDNINNKLNQTEYIANYIGESIKGQKNLNIKDCVNIIGDKEFDDIYIFDIYGNTTSIKSKQVNISDSEYFKKAIKGEKYISNHIDYRLKGMSTISCSVPIKTDNETIGVLVTTISVENICSKLKLNQYRNLGNIYISNSNGDIVACDDEKKEYPSLFEDVDFINEIKLKFKNNDSKSSELIQINNQTQIIGYKKLEDFKDLYVVTSTPQDSILKNVQEVYKMVVIIAMTLILLGICISMYILNVKKNSEKSISKLAYEDSLTGIRNYNKLIRDGQEFINKRNKRECSVICFDIRRFNFLNDLYGYSTGDDILKTVGEIMKNQLSSEEVFGRLSNDVFCIIVEGNLSFKYIENKLLNIEKELNQRELNGEHLTIKLSAGIYELSNKDDSIKMCIDNANNARFKCKKIQGMTYCVFDEAMRIEKTNDIIIQNDIVRGLENNEFTVHYQPKINIKENKTAGAEALIRWIHHDIGFMNPDTFIPIAEKTGDINLIGRWVFEQVCKDIKNWKNEGYKVVPVSINLSRVELYQKDLVDFLDVTSKKYNIDTKLIEIEITETSALNDVEFINSRINEIKSLGISVSMDDFGVGNSTLSNLKRVDIDTLKIDRSLLLDIEKSDKSKDVVTTIIDLSKKLGLDVVCEGVENEEQVAILRNTECDIVQGYVYSRPVGKVEFETKFLK